MITSARKLLTCLLALTGLAQLNAQNSFKLPKEKVRCYTVEYINQQRLKNPNLETDEQFENWLAPLVQLHKQKKAFGTFGVPVKPYKMAIVFHIIYSGEAEGTGTNLAQGLINANILQLNRDYANLSSSPYAVAANTGLQFGLASVDPKGNTLAEPGIDRVDATQMGWSAGPWSTTMINDSIKPVTYWDPTRYVNVWIVQMSGGILGLSTFPSSSTLTGLDNSETDTTAGVMIDPSTVGSVFTPGGGCGAVAYNLGKTLSHELGHFFGLRHIWGDLQPKCGDDYVGDTPSSSEPHYGTFSHPNPDAVCGDPDQMFENYMDYTDDHELNTFTAEQVDRMQTVMLNSPRRISLPNTNVAITDVQGSDSISFAECSGALTFLETGNAGTTNRYRDVNIVLNVEGGASDNNTNVTIQTSGSAVQGYDYDILNPTINFAKGDCNKAIKLRIYDNATVDGDRNILFNFNINGNGLQPASSAQGLLVTILDDDNFVVGQSTVNILNETFGTSGGTLPTDWYSLSPQGYPNTFVIGTNGSAGGTGQCAYISNDANTKPNTYTKGVQGEAVLASTIISGQNVKALGTLKYKYSIRGLAGSDDAYSLYNVLYDTTNAFNYFGTTSGARGYGPYNGTTRAAKTGTLTLTPTSDMNNERFRIYFYWETGTATTGVAPGMNIDNVVFSATPFPVETGISSSYHFNVQPSSYNQFKSTNGNAVAIVLDSTGQFPNFTAAITDSGTAKKTITIAGKQYNRTSKVFTLSDSVINKTDLYTAGFYLTAAEVSAFGAAKSNLFLVHIADGTSITSTLDASNTTITPATVIDSSTNRGYLIYAGGFAGLGTFTLIDTSAILPVNLTKFTGSLVSNTVKLNWSTTSEINNKGFSVERSNDGVSFSSIGWVNGIGGTNIHNYAFIDAKVAAGNKYFYRLKQEDVIGNYAYSPVVTIVYLNQKEAYTVYPNPIHDLLVIEKNTTSIEGTSVFVSDASGRAVYKGSLNTSSNQTTIETANWAKGIYLVTIHSNDGVSTLKVIKQ